MELHGCSEKTRRREVFSFIQEEGHVLRSLRNVFVVLLAYL